MSNSDSLEEMYWREEEGEASFRERVLKGFDGRALARGLERVTVSEVKIT